VGSVDDLNKEIRASLSSSLGFGIRKFGYTEIERGLL
jgi:hypothetical protein